MDTATAALQNDPICMKRLSEHCRAFTGAQTGRSLFQIINTLLPALAVYATMVYGVMAEMYWLPILLWLPAGGLLIRIFIIQHDCGHGSFFKTKWVNDAVGRALSVITLTPYAYWRDAHNIHHAGSGNLDNRGIGSVDTLTVEEYKKLPVRKRFMYRLYRHPLLVLVFGPPLNVLVVQRFPTSGELPFLDNYKTCKMSKVWWSVMLLNAALIAFYGVLGYLFGIAALLLVFLPPVVIAACVGGWLFFVQHQFEDAYWAKGADWDFREASVMGSTFYDLPPVLQWFTGNIGLHHIHHLCSSIPNYRLQECMDASPDLQSINRMSIRESLKCIPLALWDEEKEKMVSFRQALGGTPMQSA